MLRKTCLSVMVAAMLTLALAPVCLAETWVDIPGRIVFDGDNGSITTVSFSKWLTNKSNFVPTTEKYHQQKAGYFSYGSDDKTVVMRVDEADKFELQGDNNPILITFPGNKVREVQVNNSFIWAISRMKDFHFIAKDDDTGRDVEYNVPSESIRTLSFFPEE